MRIIIILFFLILSSCSFDSVKNHHGVHFLEKKNKSLIVKKSNKNDIIKLLGPPSTQSKFDNDVWIYIEREITRGKLLNLGRNILVKNDVLVLEIDDMGILYSKNFSNIDKMKELKFSEDQTEKTFRKNNFIYNFLSSLRQKVNDPLGKRKN